MGKPDILKICILSNGLPPYYGGAEIRAYRLAQRFDLTPELHITLIGPTLSKTENDSQPYQDFVIPIHLIINSHRGSRTPIKFASHLLETALRLTKVLFKIRNRFDILHVINGAPLLNLLSIPIANALGKTTILEMTSLGSDDPLTLNSRSNKGESQIFPHRPIKYSLFLKADAYVSKSVALTNAYLEAGLRAEKLYQIPSGVDPDLYCSPTLEEKNSIRQALGIASSEINIMFIGGIYFTKGVHSLLQAFIEVNKQCPKTHLFIIGPTDRFDQEYIANLYRIVEKKQLHSSVTIIPKKIDNVSDYLQAADIFALPTRREGMSNILLEAMATGLAIVASDIPEISNVQITNNVEGRLVTLDSPTILTDTIIELVKDPVLRQRLGYAARKRVLAEFSQDRIDQLYLQLYRQMIVLSRNDHRK